MKIISAAGLSSYSELNRTHIYRRVSQSAIRRFDELYPYPHEGSLLAEPYPEQFQLEMREASPEQFLPKQFIGCHDQGLSTVNH